MILNILQAKRTIICIQIKYYSKSDGAMYAIYKTVQQFLRKLICEL